MDITSFHVQTMKYRMYVDDAIWQKSKIAPVLKLSVRM